MNFQEIAFKAELNRQEPEDAAKEAWLLCGENPRTRDKAIEELRHLIKERGECHPHRMDDQYLVRFLRARRFVPARAHRLMVRYCTFREQNPHLWRDVDWLGCRKLGGIITGVLYDRPDVGRLLLLRMDQWNPEEISVDELIRGTLLMLDIGIMQPKVQLVGGTGLLDCQGMTTAHIRQLSPSVAVQASHVMGYSFPVHIHGIHVINCSRLFEKMLRLFQRFSPADGLWKKVHFHGHDISSLHRYVPPECLPKRYGGLQEEVTLSDWLTKINHYAGKDFHDEMRRLGYADHYTTYKNNNG